LLSDSGFSNEDIEAFRRAFHARRGTLDAPAEERERLEAAWMTEGSGITSNDTDAQVLAAADRAAGTAAACGVAAGFFFGPLALVPLVIATNRAGLEPPSAAAIAIGIILNCAFGILFALS
jgi:hypothetical protein